MALKKAVDERSPARTDTHHEQVGILGSLALFRLANAECVEGYNLAAERVGDGACDLHADTSVVHPRLQREQAANGVDAVAGEEVVTLVRREDRDE